jgi:hypothetical protein
MPEEKPPKKSPKKRSPRTFTTAISFHLTPKLHLEMKDLAAERGVNLEDVYRKAAEHFLERREVEEISYRSPPFVQAATRVYVLMADELRTRMRAAAKSDNQALVNAFETAVRLYLASLNRSGFW